MTKHVVCDGIMTKLSSTTAANLLDIMTEEEREKLTLVLNSMGKRFDCDVFITVTKRTTC